VNKRRRLGLIVVLGLAITAAAFFALRPREPEAPARALKRIDPEVAAKASVK